MRAMGIRTCLAVLIQFSWIPVLFPATTKTQWLAETPETNCKPRDEMISFITRSFGETIRGAGTSREGNVELWHSPGGRTFTILLVKPNGFMCPITFGDNWLRR